MSSPRLRIVLPLAYDENIRDYCISIFAGHLPDTELSVSFLLDSVTSTVSDYDQYRNAPWILKTVQAAVRDSVDGIFVDIAFDTALSAAKCLGVPVVGALEAAVAHVRMISRRFSILAINEEEVPVNFRLSREYGYRDMLTSVEPIYIGVLELQMDREKTIECLVAASQRAIDSGAQAVVLGCTAMSWAARPLAERIPVPVLDTNLIGLYMLYSQARLRFGPSPFEYPTPSGLVALTEEEYQEIRSITFLLNE